MVVTLPAYEVEKIVPAALRARSPVLQRLSELRPCAYISTYIWLDRKVTDKMFWAREFDPASINCEFYDFSNIYPGYAHRVH